MNQSSRTSSLATSRIAVISATWHRELVQQATGSLVAELAANGVPAGNVAQFEVPGAFEIPLHAQKLLATGRYDAVVAVALVVDGGIYRHEFVAATVVDALMRVQLEAGKPVFSVVLTPHHFHEHDTHQRFFRDHLVQKGTEAAHACLRTLEGLRDLERLANV